MAVRVPPSTSGVALGRSPSRLKRERHRKEVWRQRKDGSVRIECNWHDQTEPGMPAKARRGATVRWSLEPSIRCEVHGDTAAALRSSTLAAGWQQFVGVLGDECLPCDLHLRKLLVPIGEVLGGVGFAGIQNNIPPLSSAQRVGLHFMQVLLVAQFDTQPVGSGKAKEL